MVSSRGVQVGDDTLQIDEFHYRVSRPDVDFQQLLTGPDIALALVELAADPGSELLQNRVVSRLAIAHGWFQHAPSSRNEPGFQNEPGLDVSASRISGAGIGRLLDGLFIWRAHDERDTFTYLVTPSLQARDLLKADPGLARALIQVACPRPDDPHGALERRLAEAITRLAAGAASGAVASAPKVDTAGVVLEVKSAGAAVQKPDAQPDLGEPDPGSERESGPGSAPDPPPDSAADRVLDPAAGPAPGRRRGSGSERALSEELADLARKVGVAAVRPAERGTLNGHSAGPRPGV